MSLSQHIDLNDLSLDSLEKLYELATNELPNLKREQELLSSRLLKTQAEINQFEFVVHIYSRRKLGESKKMSIEKYLEEGKQTVSFANSEVRKTVKNLDNIRRKILYVARHPEYFGKEYIEGGKDFLEIIYDCECGTDPILNKHLRGYFETNIFPNVSFLYESGQLVKYRIKNSKNKFVSIHPDWLDHEGKFVKPFDIYESYLELVPKKEKKSTIGSVDEKSVNPEGNLKNV